jgi:CheY-like chemotaxis protein/tetratricopeptide (TPR) repeat protein
VLLSGVPVATLLLVEDDPEIRTVLGLYLARRGYEVLEAGDGKAGLDTFFSRGADLILLDALLPKMDGLGVLKALRADERGRDVPVIVLSAVYREMVFAGENSDALGVVGFLTKPFQLRQVLQIIEKTLAPTARGDPTVQTRTPTNPPGRSRRLEPPRDAVPPSGDLADRPIADLLPALGTEARSGRLTLTSGDVIKQVVFRNGLPVFAASSLREETLGRYLVRAGVFDEDRLEALRAIAASRQTKLGEVILAESAMDPHALYERIREHMVEKIVRAFAWTEGRFEFAPGEAHANKETLVRMDVPSLVLEGVRLHTDASEVARQLPVGPDARAFVRPDAAYPVEGLPLPPVTQRVLSLAQREETLADIAKAVGQGVDAIRKEIYALWSLRVVGLRIGEAGAEEPARRAPVEVPARRPSSGVLPRRSTEAAQAVSALLGDYLRVKGKDHFAVLGLTRSAGPDEIRHAWSLARERLDPANLPPEITGEMMDRAEELLRAIDDAYATLSNPGKRAAYERSLASEAVAGRDPVMDAERELREARKLVRHGRAAEAVESLRRLLRRAPSEPTYAVELALALFHTDAKLHRDEIERLATRARKSSPDLSDPWFVLGKIALEDGDRQKAEQLFQRALASDPKHAEAQRELRMLAIRK